MAPHDGAAQAEERSPLRLPNKIADSDPTKNHRVRHSIAGDVKRIPSFPCFIQNLSILTTMLPPHWKKLPPELKYFVEKEMFDPVLRQVLEDDNIINWAPSATKLYPLITTGDGNCLLHAISLAMWGVEDEELFLRSLLHEFLSSNDLESRKRWQRERKKLDERIPGSGLRYNTMEWRSEWEMVIKMASTERRTANPQTLPYESLEEFHIFVMANILRRPIVVMAQPSWHDLQGNSLQPQNFGGIYLPLKWKPEECGKQPIILGYYQMHFVPLVYTGIMDDEISVTDFAVPLVSRDHTPMEIHFLNEEERGTDDELLQQYLALEEIPHMDINESMASAHVIRGAQLSTAATVDESNLMVSYFKLVESHYRFYLETEYNPQGAAGPGDVANEEPKLVETMSKINREAPPPQQSDLWTPALNPNYKSNAPNDLQEYPPRQTVNNLSPWPTEGAKIVEVQQQQQVIHSMVDQSCATPGCQYYRSVSTGEYCHECYNKLKGSSATSTNEQASKLGEGSVKCRTEGCFNVSVPGQNDHCQVCLDSAKFKGNVGSVTGPSVTAPSAPLPSHVGLPSGQTTSNVSPPGRNVLVDAVAVNQSKPYHSASAAQDSNVSEDDLTTLVVNTVRVGSKKCIMPECQMTGHPDTHDMCGKCFNENRKIHKNVMAAKHGGGATSAEKFAASPPLQQQLYQQRKPCKTSGCNGLGNPHIDGYCAQCGIKTSLRNENTATPPSVAPPDYSQAMRIIKGGSGTDEYNRQTGYVVGYNASANHPPANRDPNPQEFTVPKHICTTPGCSGIRLDNDAGYCWQCVRKNKLTVAPTRTTTPPPTPRQSWIQPVSRSQTPPPKSSRPPLTQEYPTRNQPAMATNRLYQSTTTISSKTGSMSTRMCRHPKCDRPAAPPKYILCEECIRIAELYKREEAEDETFESRPGTQPLPQPAVQMSSQMPTNSSSTKMAAPAVQGSRQNVVYIKRQKCQAPNGCKDEMYGDPELNNLCSSCFKDSLRRHPFQRPGDVYSAPLKPSPRAPTRQSSHSQELPKPTMRQQQQQQPQLQKREFHVPSHDQRMYGNQVIIAGEGTSPVMIQAGQVPYYQCCATPDCQRPANPNILEGYCNHCYRAYNEVFVETKPAGTAVLQPAAVKAEPYHLDEQRRGSIEDQLYQRRGEPVGQPAVAEQPAIERHPLGYGKEQEMRLPGSAKPKSKLRCKHDWCNNYGNPRCLGYCNECYELTLMCK